MANVKVTWCNLASLACLSPLPTWFGSTLETYNRTWKRTSTWASWACVWLLAFERSLYDRLTPRERPCLPWKPQDPRKAALMSWFCNKSRYWTWVRQRRPVGVETADAVLLGWLDQDSARWPGHLEMRLEGTLFTGPVCCLFRAPFFSQCRGKEPCRSVWSTACTSLPKGIVLVLSLISYKSSPNFVLHQFSDDSTMLFTCLLVFFLQWKQYWEHLLFSPVKEVW
jgi:hypothetical protein